MPPEEFFELETHRVRQLGASVAFVQPHRITKFQPIPFPPRRPAPYHMALESVARRDVMDRIRSDRAMTFHCAGDTGGVKRPEVQKLVARGMEYDMQRKQAHPAFFYHLGDVVYYNGLPEMYFDQFYDPYEHYPPLIFAIPGNHDGEIANTEKKSLDGFYRNFCAEPRTYTPESQDTGRMAMCQPYVYWSLDTPYAYFIGLYTNVPEGGRIDDQQRAWFHNEMAEAPEDKALLVALHHPVYSFDDHHSGSVHMAKELQDAINASRRVPNAVLTGHVHNYQRIEHVTENCTIPFFVIGNGGYWNLHHLISLPGHVDQDTGAKLVAAIDDRHGFATFEVGARAINGRFTTVPRPQESWSDPGGYNGQADTFSYPTAPCFLKGRRTVTLIDEESWEAALQADTAMAPADDESAGPAEA